MALSLEQKAEIVSLRGLGESYQSIADKLKISKVTVHDVCSREAVAVQYYRQDFIEEVAHSYRLLVRDRLERLGKLADRYWRELETRPLGDVSVSALFRMYVESLKAIQTQVPLQLDLVRIDPDEYLQLEYMKGDPKLYRKFTDSHSQKGRCLGDGTEVWREGYAKEETGRVRPPEKGNPG